MRLCYIANPNSIHIQRWIRYFAAQGHKVFLIGEHVLQSPLPPNVVFHDLTTSINLRKIRYLFWAGAVRRIVRGMQPDLLHAHQVVSAGWLGAAAGHHPFVVTAWGSDLLLAPHRHRVHRQLALWVLRRADYTTCVSEELAQAALSLGADPGRLEIAPWGVDTSIFHPVPESRRTAVRSQLGLGQGPIVLSMRAMAAVYNPLVTAHAIPRVLEQVPSAQFVIRTYNADQRLLGKFLEIVQDNQVTDAVRYIGELPNDTAIADLYRAADVAISVPSSDGAPSSVLEALACNTVPVLSDLPSLHQWVQHEREGLFVPVGDAAATSAAIIRLLTNDSLRSQLRTNGADLVRRRADSSVWMRHYERIYHQLIERSGDA